MNNSISVRKAQPSDITELQTLCRQVYATYFGDHWLEDGLELYLEEQFGTNSLKSDLEHETIGYFFICYAQAVVGFLKLNFEAKLNEDDPHTTCELEKMYILPEYKNNGIGKVALSTVIDLLNQKGIPDVFLGVLASNKAGRRFYESVGFTYHSTIRLHYTLFKEELKGLDILFMQLQ